MLRRITLALLVLGLLFALGFVGMAAGWVLGLGRGPAAVGQPVPTGGELRLFGAEPQTLDPALATDAESARYIVEIFSGLVALDKDLRVIADIAQSWDVDEDGKVYTFHLRSGVTFHNGRPVTAEDFKYSLERAASPATGSTTADTYLGDIVGVKEKLQGKASTISGVRVVDGATLQIEIDAPKAYFLAKLTYPTAFVVDRANVESGQDWMQRPNGTGPFSLREWRHRQRLVLERYGAFYGGPAKINRVTFLIGGGVPLTMYENGELDITYVGPGDIERVTDPRNPLSKELVILPELNVNYIGFDARVPPFDDVKVRQALTLAVDREKLTALALKGLYPAARGILPPGMPGYNKDLKGLEYNPQKARDLLAQSKYEGVAGLPPIVYSVSGTGMGLPPWDRAILDMWRENLGLSVQVQEVSPSDYYQEVDRGGLQMFSLGWIADYPDPQNFLDVLFHSQSKSNNSGYSNPQVDELLQRARVGQDEAARFQLYRQAEEIIISDAPWLPLWHSVSRQLVKPYVKGYQPSPIIIPTFKEVYMAR